MCIRTICLCSEVEIGHIACLTAMISSIHLSVAFLNIHSYFEMNFWVWVFTWAFFFLRVSFGVVICLDKCWLMYLSKKLGRGCCLQLPAVVWCLPSKLPCGAPWRITLPSLLNNWLKHPSWAALSSLLYGVSCLKYSCLLQRVEQCDIVYLLVPTRHMPCWGENVANLEFSPCYTLLLVLFPPKLLPKESLCHSYFVRQLGSA